MCRYILYYKRDKIKYYYIDLNFKINQNLNLKNLLNVLILITNIIFINKKKIDLT